MSSFVPIILKKVVLILLGLFKIVYFIKIVPEKENCYLVRYPRFSLTNKKWSVEKAHYKGWEENVKKRYEIILNFLEYS